MFDFLRKKPEHVLLDWKAYDLSIHGKINNNDIEDIFNGKFVGLTLSNALSVDFCNKITEKLLVSENSISGESDFGKVIGKKLDKKEKGNFQNVKMEDYNKNSIEFKNSINKWLDTELESEIIKILSMFSTSKDIKTPDGYPIEFLPSTIRICSPNKGGITHHVGNEFILKLPESKYIKDDVILHNQLSFFFVIQAPESGGELVVYPRKFDDLKGVQDRNAIVSELESLPQLVLKPKIGDLIMFQGGNVWHKVADIIGDTDRITMGGILSFTMNKTGVRFWS